MERTVDNNRFLLTSNEIRSKFINFFLKKNHHEIEAANLLPNWDSSLLFVNSGMFPLVPYLLWETHPNGKRLVNYQRCFRTDDINEVGDMRHTTLFEMLGNWSLGDYFKKEQIAYRFEFLFEELGLDPRKIYQSTFGGNEFVGEDLESLEIVKNTFKKYGIEAEVWPQTKGKGEAWPGVACDFTTQRIFQYSDKNRRQRGQVVWEVWWPDTETFYDTGKPHNEQFGKHCHVNCDCGRFIEIGNSVFIQYVLKENGRTEIEHKNVDFGGWLERITMAVQQKDNVFLTDVFYDYVSILEKTYWIMYADHAKDIEVIIDHCRAIAFLIIDWCQISNKDQWYFLRRLMRRVFTKIYLLNIELQSVLDISNAIVEKLWAVYTAFQHKQEEIIAAIIKEHQWFSKNLIKGVHFFKKIVAEKKTVSGEDAFLLQGTYWFPIELIKELCGEHEITLDEAGYMHQVEEHRNISRQWADKKFKSWLGDASVQTTKYHTLTHLLHQTLIDFLGKEVQQKWSNITQERLRFDFSYSPAIDSETVAAIESAINKKIDEWFVVESHIENTTDALNNGAIGLFWEKYPEKVSVYSMTNPAGVIISKEICTWPHVQNANELSHLQIVECKSIWSNIKRIKAILVEAE